VSPAGGSVAVSDWRKSSKVILASRDAMAGRSIPQSFPDTLSIFRMIPLRRPHRGGDHEFHPRARLRVGQVVGYPRKYVSSSATLPRLGISPKPQRLRAADSHHPALRKGSENPSAGRGGVTLEGTPYQLDGCENSLLPLFDLVQRKNARRGWFNRFNLEFSWKIASINVGQVSD